MEQTELWWITGASSGIGQALALEMAQSGKKVVASARSESALRTLSTQHDNIYVYPLDVTDTEAVFEAVDNIEEKFGPIHGAILNAGIYEPMSSSEFSFASTYRTFDVNVFGIARALEPLIPKLEQRGAGHLVLMASLAGWRGLPKAIAYGASKAAVKYMADVLRIELHDKGIKVQVIHPGFVDTPATKVNTFKMPFLMTPEQSAEKIMKGLQKNSLSISFPTPFVAIFKIMGMLPDFLYIPFTRKSTKV